MRLSGLFSTLACVALLLTVLPVQAEDVQTKDTEADIPGWIKQLDSSKFSERELASVCTETGIDYDLRMKS